jgi:hypothetical protein
MKIRRFLAFLLPFLALMRMHIVPDEGGGADDTPAGDTITPAADADTPAGDAGTTTDADAPKTLLDAINKAVPEVKPEEAAKPEPTEAEKAAALKPGDKPAAPAEDLTKMPEGLNAKAQERFQKLANANKEVTADRDDLKTRYEQVTAQVEPFREALQTNGVTREQFDQATAVIGLMNKGDLQGALAVLDEQRRLISLAMGKPLPGVDALAGFDDLRQAVDQLEITEARALEIARARSADAARTTQAQRQQEQRDQQDRAKQAKDAEQTEVQTALTAVDEFTKKMQETDLDFAAIEAKLLPEIPGLLQGVPPGQWVAKVEKLYALIKKTAGGARRDLPHANSLRATGGNTLASQPKTMLDAMFPTR